MIQLIRFHCKHALRARSINHRSFYGAVDSLSDSEKELFLYSGKKQTPVSLKSFMDTGKGSRFDLGYPTAHSHTDDSVSPAVLIHVACFLHRELPVRLAHRAVKLDAAANFKNEHFSQVANWYKQSFHQIRACPAPSDSEKESYFAKVIEEIYYRHGATLIKMAKGAHELRLKLNMNMMTFAEMEDIQKTLDEFYMSRIGIRMLIGQYLALREPSDEHMVGMISQFASPSALAKQAIADATYMCERVHGEAPEVTIHGRTDLTFPYVSNHIHYVLLELLKNSMRATVEHHKDSNKGKLPPIRVVIADGEQNEDVVIKVSDEGGGIRRSNMHRIWSYLFTTADPAVIQKMLDDEDAMQDFEKNSPLAGLGFGLPISRNYCRFFGGDLNLMSMEGYGTDSFIYLPRLGDKDSAL